MKLPKLHMEIKTRTASERSYDTSYKRPYSDIKWQVIHSTNNDGDTDEGNAAYFSPEGSNRTYAGAHGFVDDDSCTKSVPLNRAAYAVGGSLYNDVGTTGGGRLYGKVTNANSISIEICDTMKDGVIDISEKTFRNAVEVAAYYALKYNIPRDHIVRHFDVTGKKCPSAMIGRDNVLWNHFLQEVYKLMDECEKT